MVFSGRCRDGGLFHREVSLLFFGGSLEVRSRFHLSPHEVTSALGVIGDRYREFRGKLGDQNQFKQRALSCYLMIG